jgi:precorrin-6B methylase 1
MNNTRQLVFLLVVVVAVAGSLCWASQAAAWGRGHLYVIGTGPAGPGTATLQALNTIKQMDVIAAPDKHVKLFAEYVGNKPILFDPWTGIWDYKGKKQDELSKEEFARFKVERFRIRDERVEKIKGLLAEGKDVGLLDSGNPCLYGPSHWYVEQFDQEDVVIIPGMGCDAAAMAALGKSTIPAHDTRFVIQSAPFSLMGWSMKDRQLPCGSRKRYLLRFRKSSRRICRVPWFTGPDTLIESVSCAVLWLIWEKSSQKTRKNLWACCLSGAFCKASPTSRP